jgi:hypothetical protein
MKNRIIILLSLILFFNIAPLSAYKNFSQAIPDATSTEIIKNIIDQSLQGLNNIHKKYKRGLKKPLDSDSIVNFTSTHHLPFHLSLKDFEGDSKQEIIERTELLEGVPFNIVVDDSAFIYGKYIALSLVPDLSNIEEPERIMNILNIKPHLSIMKWRAQKFKGLDYSMLVTTRKAVKAAVNSIKNIIESKKQKDTKINQISNKISEIIGCCKKVFIEAWDLSKKKARKALAKLWINGERDDEDDIRDIALDSKNLKTNSIVSYNDVFKIVETLKNIIDSYGTELYIFFSQVTR